MNNEGSSSNHTILVWVSIIIVIIGALIYLSIESQEDQNSGAKQEVDTSLLE